MRIARLQNLNKRKIPISLRLSMQHALLPLIVFCAKNDTSAKLAAFDAKFALCLRDAIELLQKDLSSHFGEPCNLFPEGWWQWITRIFLADDAAAAKDLAKKLNQLVKSDAKLPFVKLWLKTL